MPNRMSHLIILSIGIILVLAGTYFVSDISTRKLFLRESRLLAYESILNIDASKTDDFLLEKAKIDQQFETLYNLDIPHKETASWSTLLLGVILILLALFDYRLYRHRTKKVQTQMIVSLVEENIEFLMDKRQAEFKTSNAKKWEFDKGIFIDNTIKKKIPKRLMLNKDELLTIIDKIIDGTL